MDLWERARSFAGEAARRSQEISNSPVAARLTDFAGEAARRSREIAADAAKRAEALRLEAARAAGQIKALAADIPVPATIAAVGGRTIGTANLSSADVVPEPPHAELEKFGVTQDLREFVKGLTISTFRDFPLQDEPEMSEVPTVSNVRQDLNEWQAKHAMLMLSTVQEISKFRYELCPRYMKERKFWRIYFLLVNNFVTPYESQYMELKMKMEQEQRSKEVLEASHLAKVETNDGKIQGKTSTKKNTEQDLDVFLLGDLGSDDEGSPVDGAGLDDLDKIGGPSGLESDDDEEEKSKPSTKVVDSNQ